jgi:hypothetical protein
MTIHLHATVRDYLQTLQGTTVRNDALDHLCNHRSHD